VKFHNFTWSINHTVSNWKWGRWEFVWVYLYLVLVLVRTVVCHMYVRYRSSILWPNQCLIMLRKLQTTFLPTGSTSPLGEGCANSLDCMDVLASCSGNPSVCTCPSTHYDSNGDIPAGSCMTSKLSTKNGFINW